MITIIVILLALIVPSLDVAIYKAELTACGVNTRNIAMGVSQYALDHKRAYPHRAGVVNSWQPVTVQRGGTAVGNDRPQLTGYISMGLNGHLNCPLVKKVDVEGSHADTWILVPYALYFGWQLYKDGVPLRGQNRVGNRLSWRVGLETYSFDVLAGDDSLVIRSDNWGHGTHPDKAGKWAELKYQDQSLLADALPTTVTGPTGYKATFSRFTGPPADRGPVDLNFALQDGSVIRTEDVDYREGAADDPRQDHRVAAIPYTAQANDTTSFYRQLPLQLIER